MSQHVRHTSRPLANELTTDRSGTRVKEYLAVAVPRSVRDCSGARVGGHAPGSDRPRTQAFEFGQNCIPLGGMQIGARRITAQVPTCLVVLFPGRKPQSQLEKSTDTIPSNLQQRDARGREEFP